MTSTVMSGYFGRIFAKAGIRIARGVLCRRDPDVAGRLLAKLTQSGEFGVHLLEFRPDAPEQALSRLGRRHASGRAVQQPHPEPFLKATDGLAESGLRNAELGCRARETALPGNRQKCEEITGVLTIHSLAPLIIPISFYHLIGRGGKA
jgi:hypothetical protein